ncbi:MAG TPA: bifunctional glutamate N-acetyltransferase/amino-acid acetyltransferase ArgJ [Polyangia bacterium]|nr:bifunctional glutamate N-acetyltransferase/amino-acid acetyltransferase ArgJ [Polyangia bacterium]
MVVPGFRFAGVAAGIKKPAGALDLGLLCCDRPAAAAAVFTQNRVKAAPVILSAARIARGGCQAIIANSGGANACTGREGQRDAYQMAAGAAHALGIDEQLVCVASTGVIGQRLPIERVLAALPRAAAALRPGGLVDFARAILTTDKGPKWAAARRLVGKKEITVAGVAKGAGMIAPNLATTLSFVVTDAACDRVFLRGLLREVADATLNSITVDGDTSTNDACFLLAGGAAGNATLRGDDKAGRLFRELLHDVLAQLAHQLVRDGEGATKVVTIEVVGAESVRDARLVARRVANSPLVKTALGGADPNWGRVLAAVGNAGIEIDPDRIDVDFGGVRLVARGQAAGGDSEARAHEIMQQAEYVIRIHLHSGRAEASYLTCDLTHEYVRINADYRS